MTQIQTKRRKLSACSLLLATLFSLSTLLAPKPALATNAPASPSISSSTADGSAMVVLYIVATQIYLMNIQAITRLLNRPLTVLKTDDGMNNALTRKLLKAMIYNPELTRTLISKMSKQEQDRLREILLEREVKQISALIDASNIIASGLGATNIPESQGARRTFILNALLARARFVNNASTDARDAQYFEAIKKLVALDIYSKFVRAWLKIPNVGPR